MKKFLHNLAGRKVVNTFFLVSVMAFIAKLAIAGKELAVAARFGRGDELDAYLIAFVVPSFVVSIFGNAMNSAFVPVYIKIRASEDQRHAFGLFSSMYLLATGMLAIIAALLFFLTPLYLPIIASGFEPSKLALTTRLIRIMIPFVVLSGTGSLWSAVLNAQERFALVVLTPMLTPLLMVGLLLFDPGIGVYALAYAILLGAVMELLVTGTALYMGGFSLWPRWLRASAVHLKATVSQFLPSIIGGLLMSSTVLVDQSMAAMLPPGSVAALSYGNKILGFVLSILSTTIITVLTPYFSKKLSGRVEYDPYKPPGRSVLLVFSACLLFPILIAFFNTEFVKIVFYRGAFTMADVKLVAGVQSYLIWQIPFYISAIILVRYMVSMRLNWILTFVAGFNMLVNIMLNFLLMKRMGVYGIALSTTFVHAGSLLLLVFFVYFSNYAKNRVFYT